MNNLPVEITEEEKDSIKKSFAVIDKKWEQGSYYSYTQAIRSGVLQA